MTVERIGVLDLLRSPGATRRVSGAIPLGDVGITNAHLDPAVPVSYDVNLEARGGQLVVTGTVRGEWVGACRRCLEPTRGTAQAHFTEIFEAHHVEGETWPIENGAIDLGSVVTEAVLLELPLAPLCRDDCAGPEPDRYPTIVEDFSATDDTAEPGADPRWAALEGLHIDED